MDDLDMDKVSGALEKVFVKIIPFFDWLFTYINNYLTKFAASNGIDLDEVN